MMMGVFSLGADDSPGFDIRAVADAIRQDALNFPDFHSSGIIDGRACLSDGPTIDGVIVGISEAGSDDFPHDGDASGQAADFDIDLGCLRECRPWGIIGEQGIEWKAFGVGAFVAHVSVREGLPECPLPGLEDIHGEF
jgi:hypothetical protein